MFKSSSELISFIKKENVALVDVRFIDLPGIQHHFNVPAHQFTEDVFTNDFSCSEESQVFLGIVSVADRLIKCYQLHQKTKH